MNGVQHKTFGVACGLAYVWYKGADASTALALATAAFGASLPDWDHQAKKENKAIKKTVRTTNSIVNLAAYVIGGVSITALLVPMFIKNEALNNITSKVNTFTEKYFMWIAALAAFIIVKELITRSKTFKWAVAHRGLMHTLIPPALIWFGRNMFLEGNMFYAIINGIFIGYCSHIYIDLWNKDGCPLLFPFTKKDIGLHLMPTKNVKGCWAIIFLNAGALLALAYMYGKGMR